MADSDQRFDHSSENRAASGSRGVASGRLARLADLIYRRRGRVVLSWIATLAVVLAVGPSLAGEFDADYATPGSQSQAARELIAKHFPGSSGETIDVVWQAAAGVGAASVEDTINRFLAEASKLEGVGEPRPTRVGPGGEIAVARLELERPSWDVPVDTGEKLIKMAQSTSAGGLRVELGGGPIEDAQEGGSPEVAGLIAAAVILLVAFGSAVAVGLPIVSALFGLAISSTLIGMVAAVVDTPDWSTAVASLIGLGVGIDYALLILTRYRAALGNGAPSRDALGEAMSTAGRSTLVAGSTVIVSLLGLFLMQVPYLYGVALAAGLAVLVVMAASLTLVPALLAFAGPRIERLRIPGLARPTSEAGHDATGKRDWRIATDEVSQDRREWPAERWSRAVQRRPRFAALAAAALLIALAAPVLGMRFGFPDAGNTGQGTTTKAAFALLTEAFGAGANGPLLVALELPQAPGKLQEELAGVADRLRAQEGVAQVADAQISPDGEAALLRVLPTTSPQAAETAQLVERLRGEVLPATLAGTGIGAFVGGTTASVLDQSDLIAARLPLFIGGVLALSFGLLLAAFRAPVIAVKAALMNLLSIGAAYGVVALVAGGGLLGGLVGIDSEVPVPPFVPVIMFAILFGLSMDYEVFLLSRVREEFLRGGQTSRAVAEGLARTARVITAAAAIMVAVFLAFVLSGELIIKLLGVGMATAIFVDATLVRMVLVPAVMQLLGRRNWWIPRWLDRALPQRGVESTSEPARA